MSFFQNLIDQEFRANLVLADRQYVITFSIPANKNRSDYQLSWNAEPYDLSSDNTLTLNYAYDEDLKNYSVLAINIAGATAAATLASEIATLLNANATFADMWVASVLTNGSNKQVLITAKSARKKQHIRLWIANSSAEKKLGFNKGASVRELPTYFARHTIANRFVFTDSIGFLVELDETDAVVDIPIIEAAGFVAADMLEDWELLRGRSGLFLFKKITVDASSRITEIIEYSAGSVPGDLAKKTIMTYTGAKTEPDKSVEIPYVLASGDLVTP